MNIEKYEATADWYLLKDDQGIFRAAGSLEHCQRYATQPVTASPTVHAVQPIKTGMEDEVDPLRLLLNTAAEVLLLFPYGPNQTPEQNRALASLGAAGESAIAQLDTLQAENQSWRADSVALAAMLEQLDTALPDYQPCPGPVECAQAQLRKLITDRQALRGALVRAEAVMFENLAPDMPEQSKAIVQARVENPASLEPESRYWIQEQAPNGGWFDSLGLDRSIPRDKADAELVSWSRSFPKRSCRLIIRTDVPLVW